MRDGCARLLHFLAKRRNARIAGIGDEHQRGRIEEAVEAEPPVAIGYGVTGGSSVGR
ncbi:MAG: hypothetical protein K0Q64_516 [Nitrobacter vulgaris]|nr:hypothetical protein [Nitrobacter vulgaris]